MLNAWQGLRTTGIWIFASKWTNTTSTRSTAMADYIRSKLMEFLVVLMPVCISATLFKQIFL